MPGPRASAIQVYGPNVWFDRSQIATIAIRFSFLVVIGNPRDSGEDMRVKLIGWVLCFSVCSLLAKDGSGGSAPTLKEWGTVTLLSAITFCALFFMRKRSRLS
jgi:hypothetical protein